MNDIQNIAKNLFADYKDLTSFAIKYATMENKLNKLQAENEKLIKINEELAKVNDELIKELEEKTFRVKKTIKP